MSERSEAWRKADAAHHSAAHLPWDTAALCLAKSEAWQVARDAWEEAGEMRLVLYAEELTEYWRKKAG